MKPRTRHSAPANLLIYPTALSSIPEKELIADQDIEMNSPLGSPTLAASTAKFRNKVPAQMMRYIRLYVICVCVILIILNTDVLWNIPSPWDLIWDQDSTPQVQLSTNAFPQKIWQTWKANPFDFEERDSVNSKTWVAKNPGMRYEVLTDANEMAYVEEHFGPKGFNRPDIVHFYRTINLPIIKADLLRYMVMYAEGGVYADIDVEALKPVNRFIPERYNEKDIDMIVGVEIDQPAFKDHPILGKKSMSFCQWTFISRPGQPVMLRLIENIMSWFKGVAKKQGVSLGQVELDFDQVITGTGPSAFTIALLEEMNKHNRGPKITWDSFHNMDESKVVSRVLVLDVEAFCAGQGHSDSGNHNARGALVKHHYHASNWPSRHARFSHPAYGQVEDCNWDAECVQKWDENVAEFGKLPEEEQKQKIDERNMLLQQE
ncbi:family 32 glycosyltransferase [Thelonectria olida]|uniref:Family 32 glycosyltransferase n=1 Tax=Thelonectria olida TaxID=1576542 RepID=A0A9P8VY85_9HYPO|nr:family 32 glycosyltransferase [Thelonectria olida]